jgi:hypothetical protein
VLPPETSGKYIPLIARYTNSQNRVSDADFFSNHEFHRRIEQIALRLRAPAVGGAQFGTHWFYERAHIRIDQRVHARVFDRSLHESGA